ncbi:MAG: hypothetical protein ACKVP7_04165 [Hyphomicrobiaceae bacterium]
MNPVDHVVAEKAIQAKKAKQAAAHAMDKGDGRQIGSIPTTTSRALAAGIWVAAIGSMVAVFMMR